MRRDAIYRVRASSTSTVASKVMRLLNAYLAAHRLLGRPSSLCENAKYPSRFPDPFPGLVDLSFTPC